MSQGRRGKRGRNKSEKKKKKQKKPKQSNKKHETQADRFFQNLPPPGARVELPSFTWRESQFLRDNNFQVFHELDNCDAMPETQPHFDQVSRPQEVPEVSEKPRRCSAPPTKLNSSNSDAVREANHPSSASEAKRKDLGLCLNCQKECDQKCRQCVCFNIVFFVCGSCSALGTDIPTIRKHDSFHQFLSNTRNQDIQTIHTILEDIRASRHGLLDTKAQPKYLSYLSLIDQCPILDSSSRIDPIIYETSVDAHMFGLVYDFLNRFDEDKRDSVCQMAHKVVKDEWTTRKENEFDKQPKIPELSNTISELDSLKQQMAEMRTMMEQQLKSMKEDVNSFQTQISSLSDRLHKEEKKNRDNQVNLQILRRRVCDISIGFSVPDHYKSVERLLLAANARQLHRSEENAGFIAFIRNVLQESRADCYFPVSRLGDSARLLFEMLEEDSEELANAIWTKTDQGFEETLQRCKVDVD